MYVVQEIDLHNKWTLIKKLINYLLRCEFNTWFNRHFSVWLSNAIRVSMSGLTMGFSIIESILMKHCFSYSVFSGWSFFMMMMKSFHAKAASATKLVFKLCNNNNNGGSSKQPSLGWLCISITHSLNFLARWRIWLCVMQLL